MLVSSDLSSDPGVCKIFICVGVRVCAEARGQSQVLSSSGASRLRSKAVWPEGQGPDWSQVCIAPPLVVCAQIGAPFLPAT